MVGEQHFDKDENFILELKKSLPNEPSGTEIDIALRDFHDGMEMDAIVNHLIFGEAFWNDLY